MDFTSGQSVSNQKYIENKKIEIFSSASVSLSHFRQYFLLVSRLPSHVVSRHHSSREVEEERERDDF